MGRLADETIVCDDDFLFTVLSDEEKENFEVVPRKNKTPENALEQIKDNTDKETLDALPAKFDLRDKIGITVGDQGGSGLCWNFATSTSLETNLKLRGIDYNPSEYYMDVMTSGYLYGDR